MGCGLVLSGAAQAEPSPTPLASPAFSGPLRANPNPYSIDVGGFGKLSITGQLTGLGIAQGNAIPYSGPDNRRPLLDVGNAQIEVQTTGGPLQFYVQAGAYALPSLGTAYMRATDAMKQLYGPVPVAYGKVQITPWLSVQAGLLPTLIGAESTFSFQNMNISRGLLWNQEPAISRGVQANFGQGAFSASVSLNDGFYSGKLSWLSGLASWAVTPTSTIAIAAGGNLGETRKSTPATPLAQNNGSIFNIIYTYSDGPLTISPYLQYALVSANADLGIDRRAETAGAAILARYAFTDQFSLAGRVEYIAAISGGCGARENCVAINLLYGPGSRAWSVTLTPTYQQGLFFVRGEMSYTHINRPVAGYAFGANLDQRGQTRGMVEAGILF